MLQFLSTIHAEGASRRAGLLVLQRVRAGLVMLLGPMLVSSALAPRIALAQVVELGAAGNRVVAPACPPGVAPSHCTIVLTRTTAVQTLTGGVPSPTTVTATGKITAFTVGVSGLSSNPATVQADVHYLDGAYGGEPQIAITVLKQLSGTDTYQVVAESQPYHLAQDLGHVVRFHLPTSIPVVPGELVGITVPTWAPVLSIYLDPNRFQYRQSRQSDCENPAASQTAQGIGSIATYGCNYKGSRAEYSATEVTGRTTRVLPPFKLGVVVARFPGHSGELKMTKLIVKGISGRAQLAGGCVRCYYGTAPSPAFYFGGQQGNTRTLVARPPFIFTRRTLILLNVWASGAIGRFKIYRAEPTIADTALVAQGCTPPGVALDFEYALHPKRIPRVPCQ